MQDKDKKKTDAVVAVTPQGFPWQTSDPFLFCVHHDDHYPAGNERLGPAASLAGRNLGQDFEGKDGWRMYHGEMVPGFPQHPHRGFETVTVVRRGLLDHSDSLGATARFGRGDVQWLTAGAASCTPRCSRCSSASATNPLELFQIWLNLPSRDKMVDAATSRCCGATTIPRRSSATATGAPPRSRWSAGRYGDVRAPSPPPESWASRPDSRRRDLDHQARARRALDAAGRRARARTASLYFFRGNGVDVGGQRGRRTATASSCAPSCDVALTSGPEETEVLLLQGRPIGEPVVQYGPFVMNTQAEIQQAIRRLPAHRFGGWPWASNDPVHAREEGRFARHPDGKIERPA